MAKEQAEVTVIHAGNEETYYGKTIDVIVRRLYGPKAYWEPNEEAHEPYDGRILQKVTRRGRAGGVWVRVLAFARVEGPRDADA